jgi:hypothetical protein
MFDFGQKNKDSDSFFGGNEESANPFASKQDTPFKSILGKQKSGAEKGLDAAKNLVPGFQDEPCCASMCPKLTYKQVILEIN